MYSFLKPFFRGDLYPPEEIKECDNPKYLAVAAKASACEDLIREKLKEDAGLVSELEDLHTQAIDIFGYECFNYGFKMGMALMADISTDPLGSKQK